MPHGLGATEAKDADLEKESLKPFRAAFKGPIIAAGGYLRDTAGLELTEGNADLVCFGEHTILLDAHLRSLVALNLP